MIKLRLIAQGSFRSHLAKHFEHSEYCYSDFEEGDPVISNVFNCQDEEQTEAFCKGLGIQINNLKTYANIDVSKVTKKDLMKIKFSEEQIHNFFMLRKAQYVFSVFRD